MNKTIKSKEVGKVRFALVEEADPISGHTQISIYANYDLQHGFLINEYSQAVHYFDELVRCYAKGVANV